MNDRQLTSDVELLIDRLGPLPEPAAKPVIIVVSGLPYSGKSYFCRQLAGRLPLPIIESDAMRQTLSPTPDYSKGENDRLFRACHNLIDSLLRRGVSAIFDATNLMERHREQLYRIAGRTGARLIVVRVEAPPEVIRQRLAMRQEGLDPNDKSEADWETYERMRANAQRINRNHFAVDTSRDIGPAIDKIVREVNR
ncbi:MAG: ATP-binding protein [Chloroflexota bacterium]|nr:ATP-binding protein [Chloroflexota bacterium]